MNQTLGIVKNLLAEILNYLILLAVGIVLLTDFAGIRTNLAGLCAIGLVPMFFFWVRERCRRFPVFLLLHILPAAGFWMAYRGNLVQKIWVVAVMAFLAVVSFGKKLNGREMGMNIILPPVFGGFMWVLYLIDKRQGGTCAGWLLYIVIGFMVGYFWHYFLCRFIYYMDMNNRTTENIPMGHVFRSSVLLAGGFSGISAVIMVLGSDRELMDRIGEAIRRIVVACISFLVSLLPRDTGEEAVPELLQGTGAEDTLMGDMEAAEPSMIMKILEAVLEVAVMAALAVLFLVAIVRLVKFIRDVFARKRVSSVISDGTHEDLVEKLERQDGRKREEKKGTLWQRAQKAVSPEERIRRIYKKAVERKLASLEEKQKGELTKAKTPREWCGGLFPEQGEKAMEFAGLYEKARYGFGLCDGGDVKRARKLAEEFHR